jgi:hypothetical protein
VEAFESLLNACPRLWAAGASAPVIIVR